YLHLGKEVMVRQVQAAGGYLSQSSQTLHFGLGHRTKIDHAEIRWPSGRCEKIEAPEINKLHRRPEPRPARGSQENSSGLEASCALACKAHWPTGSSSEGRGRMAVPRRGVEWRCPDGPGRRLLGRLGPCSPSAWVSFCSCGMVLASATRGSSRGLREGPGS